MPKLILEEGGERRAFKLGDGILTVGSGAEAKLRVTSPDVAEIHFELEIQGAEVLVRSRPGVVPPQVDGVPLTGSATLPVGRALQVGGAKLWLQGENEPAAAPARPAAAAGATPGPPRGREKRPLVPKTPPQSRSVVQRTRPRVQRGIPTPLLVVLILGAVGVAVAAYAYVTRGSVKSGAAPVHARIVAAREHVAAGNFDKALQRLDLISIEQEITDEERQEIAALRKEIGERDAERRLAQENLAGTKWLDVMLKKYEARWLVGDPESHKIRLFLKRCRLFRERWPRHPELSWVERQESRFAGTVDLTADPTWADVKWEVKYIAGGRPRNYKAAFEMLAEFQERATDDELIEVQELWDQYLADRAEYHTDRMYQAQYEYKEKDNPGGAVWWLVHGVIWSGDEEMADEAATYLVKMPHIEEHLRGYRDEYPDRYAALLAHPRVRKLAREKGLLEEGG